MERIRIISVLSTLWILLSMLTCSLGQNDQCDAHGFITKNSILVNRSFLTLYLIGIKQCSRKCSTTTKCLSFNYKRSVFSCDLNFASKNTTALTTDYQYDYYEDPSNTYSGTCQNVSCDSNSECIDITGFGPYCVLTYCNEPPYIVPHGNIKPGVNAVGQSRSYMCNAGYVMNGSPYITCKSDGSWTAIQFQCHGKVYVCEESFVKNGSPYITCKSDGSWTTIQFYCHDCGEPPPVNNAVLQPGSNLVGSTRYYTCIPKHHTVGSIFVTCQSNGVWTSTTNYCRPYRWPVGTYALYKSSQGCPTGAIWQEGSRTQDLEDNNPTTIWDAGIPNDMAGSFGSSLIVHHFCVRATGTQTSDDLPWQPGSYCILQKSTCPSGFSTGSINWDDEDNNNANGFSGTLPDGTFGLNTALSFCCRSDGSTSNPLKLPTTTPFYLLRKGGTCQSVEGMNVRSQYIRYDCEDNNPESSSSGNLPDLSSYPNWLLNFCYYYI